VILLVVGFALLIKSQTPLSAPKRHVSVPRQHTLENCNARVLGHRGWV